MDLPVAVVTGASSGIGKATATRLVKQGWRVLALGRSAERCEAAEREIKAIAPANASIEFIRADFDSMADVARAAAAIKQKTTRLDVLINNAGGVRDRRILTAEQTEATFAANHLAPFLLTRELLPLLKATAAARPGAVRVIAVSSSGHRMCPGFDWNDVQLLGKSDFNPGAAYCQAKLANILFTRELDRRVAADGIVAQAMHPGVVDSNFASHGDEMLQTHMRAQALDSPEVAAETLGWLATAPEAGPPGGRYFYNRAEAELAPQALDPEAAAKLWQASEQLLADLGFAPQ